MNNTGITPAEAAAGVNAAITPTARNIRDSKGAAAERIDGQSYIPRRGMYRDPAPFRIPAWDHPTLDGCTAIVDL